MLDPTVGQPAAEREPDNVTPEPLVLDAVVLLERRDEFHGRQIVIDFPDSGRATGVLENIFDRGWDTPQSQRLEVIMADGRHFLLGYRTRVTISPAVDEPEGAALAEPRCSACGNPDPLNLHLLGCDDLPTVDQPAAEREPSNITPEPEPENVTPAPRPWTAFSSSLCNDAWHDNRQQPTDPCPTCGDVADYAADQLLDREREPAVPEPEHVTPDLDWSAYGKCPRRSCLAAPGNPCQDLGPVGYTGPATYQLLPHADRPLVEATKAEPERRTVSLEVLTDELRAAEHAARLAEAADTYTRPEPLPADVVVAIVLRTNGEFGRVTETDLDWRGRSSSERLEAMLRQARFYVDKNAGAELLMPTPDVLAALAGTPNATWWTAPVPVLHRDMRPGWLLVSYAEEGASVPAGTQREQLIEAVAAGTPAMCKDVHDYALSSECIVLTLAGRPAHFEGWLTNPVRIPADQAVTR